MSKKYLQKKFNTISGVAAGKVLRFDSNGVLQAVTFSSSTISPQIKVSGIPSSSSTVTCVKDGISVTGNKTYYSNSYRFFNVPELGVWTITYNGTSKTVNMDRHTQKTVSFS